MPNVEVMSEFEMSPIISMNIFRYEVTDKRSAWIAVLFRTVSFAIGLLVVWLVLDPKPLVLQLTAGAAVCLVIVGFTLDHWKLRHPSTSARARTDRIPPRDN